MAVCTAWISLGLLLGAVSAAQDTSFKLKPAYTLTDATDNVESVAFSPKSNLLASASYDNKVRVYDIPANKSGAPHLKHTLNIKTKDTAWTVAFSPDEKWLAVGQVGIEMYEMGSDDNPKLQYTLDNKLEQNYVAFSSDSRWLATATEDDSNVWLYSMAGAGKPTFNRTLKAGASAVNTVAFSADGKWLATGGEGDAVWIHSLGSAATRTWKVPNDVSSVAFSPDSKWVVAGLADDLGGPSMVFAYSMDGLHNYSFTASPDNMVYAVAFSPDGRWLAVGCGDARVRIYAWKGTNEPPKLHCTTVGAQDAVLAVAFSPDGKWLAASTETQHVLLYTEWEHEAAIDDTLMV